MYNDPQFLSTNMKKFISIILFVVFFLFNVNGLDKDIEAFKNYLSNEYVLYPELVERGFDISKLDNMEVGEELFEYVEYFFRPNDEKGWLPLDNHHEFTVKYRNAASRDTASRSTTYKKSVKFSNKFGTKEELLNEGYIENETMFYYPSNGEKDWRVGEWRWTTATKAQYDKGTNFDINFSGEKTIGEKKNNGIWCDTFESEKSFVISLSKIRKNILDIELPKKENIIIDMTHSYGGTISIGEEFVSKVLNINYKRIIVLINDADSASERIIYNLSKDKEKRKGVKCFECDGYGHIQSECANTLKKKVRQWLPP